MLSASPGGHTWVAILQNIQNTLSYKLLRLAISGHPATLQSAAHVPFPRNLTHTQTHIKPCTHASFHAHTLHYTHTRLIYNLNIFTCECLTLQPSYRGSSVLVAIVAKFSFACFDFFCEYYSCSGIKQRTY